MARKSRIQVKVDGEVRPYSDCAWVVFNPAGMPVGFMDPEIPDFYPHSQDDATRWVRRPDRNKAFKRFWSWEPGSANLAMHKALQGYRIELVGPVRRKELLDQHLGMLAQRKVEQLELPAMETPESE